MKDRDWRTLVHNVATGNCIVVLGPDIAKDKPGKDGKPLVEILSNKFAKEVENERKVFNPNDLSYTAQLYADLTSENDLCLETASFYENTKPDVGSIYVDLASLPLRLVVNATPDTFLTQALEKAGKEFFVDHYNYRGKRRDLAKWDSKDKPLIYYLYGAATVPESLVISEKHLLEFLAGVISNDPPIQSNIVSEFRDKDKSFLFLGFGFRNWYLRILLYVLLGGKGTTNEKTSRSFALEEVVAPDDKEFQQICFLFKDNLKIDFSDMSIDQFVKELKGKCEEQVPSEGGEAGAAASTAAEPSAEAPTVFICHASEDKEKAMSLYDRLKSGGLNPWIDKEGIRGGDRWDQLLEKTIDETDYFIVLQSKALAAKTVGYVNKEIHLAVDRQREYRFGIKFIIPVKIEKCELLEGLDQIQTLDLTDMTNVETLITDIHRDQQRRRK